MKPILTPRQQEIVSLLAKGMKNKEIALRLNLRKGYVANQLREAYDASGMSNRVEMALWWEKHGFCE
jgi:DNA-binding NarL/FixJ family response regulator